MLIFLYGQDTYRLSKKIDEIVGEYKQRKKGLDFLIFDATADDPKAFFSGLRQNSLFLEKKFFLVKNPISNKEFKERLIEDVKEMSRIEHNIVLCQEGKVLKNDRLLAAAKKNGHCQEFPLLEGSELVSWTAQEFEKLNAQVNPKAIARLVARTGSDLWRTANEIQKLANRYPGREIGVQEVEKEVASSSEMNIFGTIDALAGRNKSRALALIKEHIAKGDHPLYLLAMIAGQFRNLVMVKAATQTPGGGIPLGRRLAIHPYVLSKTLAQANRFSLPELIGICQKIFRFDFDIKTGKIDPETGLDLLVAQI